MIRVIKSYSKVPAALREEIYISYIEQELERTTFPHQGNIVDGVIYPTDDVIYLIPIYTIVAGRAGSSGDLDDDDDVMGTEDSDSDLIGLDKDEEE